MEDDVVWLLNTRLRWASHSWWCSAIYDFDLLCRLSWLSMAIDFVASRPIRSYSEVCKVYYIISNRTDKYTPFPLFPLLPCIISFVWYTEMQLSGEDIIFRNDGNSVRVAASNHTLAGTRQGCMLVQYIITGPMFACVAMHDVLLLSFWNAVLDPRFEP